MADNASWQNQVESPQRGGVTGEVLRRRHGPIETPHPTDRREEVGEAEASEHEQAVAEGYDDKWHQRYSHLPGVPGPSDE